VPVTGYDIWRISHDQGLGPEHFVVAGAQPGEHTDGFLLKADERPHYLALDKKGRFHRFQPCVFLVDLANGSGKCGIYQSRPGACRVYPMTLNEGMIGLHKGIVCNPGSWPEEEIRRPHWMSLLKQSYLEFDLYSEVVKRWNALVAHSPDRRFALTEYFSYLLNVYAKLNSLEETIPTDELALIKRTWPVPPRTAAYLDELHLCRGDFPWLDYLVRARAAIDTFYPHVPPQPILVPMKSERRQTASA
jgi:Fe-S-cluster containining protein